MRALLKMADAVEGTATVPWRQAVGLLNRGFAIKLADSSGASNAPYICQITEAGRRFLSLREDRDVQEAGDDAERD